MNKVIFLGSEKSGKKHIIKHVLQNSELKFTSAQSIPTAQEQLNINNKYYSASVQLDYFSVHQAPPSTINWKEYQAVVAMYCTNKPSSFDQICQFVQKYFANVQFETCLCVANQIPLTEDNSKETVSDELVSTWCLDNGYEHVPYASPVLSSNSGEQEEGMFAEKEGFDRVKEALECTMWSNMDKPQAQTAPKPVQQAKDAVKTLLTKVEQPPAEALTEDEKKFEDFDQVLSDVMKLKSESANMDHQQRKARAAELAMTLFQMLKLDGEDDDEDYAGSDSDDN